MADLPKETKLQDDQQTVWTRSDLTPEQAERFAAAIRPSWALKGSPPETNGASHRPPKVPTMSGAHATRLETAPMPSRTVRMAPTAFPQPSRRADPNGARTDDARKQAPKNTRTRSRARGETESSEDAPSLPIRRFNTRIALALGVGLGLLAAVFGLRAAMSSPPATPVPSQTVTQVVQEGPAIPPPPPPGERAPAASDFPAPESPKAANAATTAPAIAQEKSAPVHAMTAPSVPSKPAHRQTTNGGIVRDNPF